MFGIVKCRGCGAKIYRNQICEECGYDNRDFFIKHKFISLILCIFIIPVSIYIFNIFTFNDEKDISNKVKSAIINDERNYRKDDRDTYGTYEDICCICSISK